MAMTREQRFSQQLAMLAKPQADALMLRMLYDHRVMGEKLGVVVQHERDLMHSMMDSVPDQIFFKHRDSRFIRINASLAKRYGLNDPAQAVGKSGADFYSADHAAQTRAEELEIMRSGQPVMNQLHKECWADGCEAWNVSMKMPLFDTRGALIGTYGIAHAITEHKKTEALNGHKRSGHGLALLMLDLDHFKEVNDTMGHSVGDALLIEASARISHCLRATDTLARMGGDEFAIILTELVDTDSIADLAQGILSSLHKPFFLMGNAVVVSASIGISLLPQDGEGFDDLLKLADQAMYEAKSQGRNGFSFFTADLQKKAQQRMRMANDLRRALASGAVTKAEALIRWKHPELGLIPPAEFISVAESIGLIVEIGDWVFRTTAQQVKQWRQNGWPNLQVAVNKSPLQFQNKNGQVRGWGDHLASIGMPPEAMVVEITEGLLLDDFGTGYSSLSYLQRFDIDYVKIDQSFMTDLGEGSKNLILCKAIVGMSHGLGMRVIA